MPAGWYKAGRSGLELESGDRLKGAGARKTFISSSSAQVVVHGRRTNDVVIRDVAIKGGRDISRRACSNGVANCGRAVLPGNGWLISRSRIYSADSQGIGSPGERLVLDQVELDHNGIKWNGPVNNGFAAGIKGGVHGGFKIVNSYVHHNNQGIWCDVDCDDSEMPFIAKNNVVKDNCSFGIHYENTYLDRFSSAAAVIAHNVVKGNDWCDLPNKADIGIVSAQRAKVFNNVTGATRAHPRRNVGIAAFNRGVGRATGYARGNRLGNDGIRCQKPFRCRRNSTR